MIRRISKKNDLRDLIKSCPTGVIDDIHTIKYFIAGQPDDEYEATFTKTGNMLEVILPSSELEQLSSGLLMRRALYSVEDPSYPDGHYDLEFVDNLNVWLGDDEVDPPYDPGYITEEDLKTINGESLVGTGNIDVVSFIPDYYATKSWVSSQTSQALTGYATQSWVQSQGYLTEHQDLSSYATKSWVSSQNYATQSWTQDYTRSQLSSFESYLTGYVLPTELSYVTQSWVQSQGYITINDIPSGLATQSWVSSNFLSTTALTGYATQSWVNSQGFLTSSTIPSDIATREWIASQEFATQSWVSSQGYVSATDLTGYATQSWVSSNYLEESKVWTGTFEQWLQMTPSQQEFYTIALIIE